MISSTKFVFRGAKDFDQQKTLKNQNEFIVQRGLKTTPKDKGLPFQLNFFGDCFTFAYFEIVI